jgi:hypothetical protein
VTDTPGSVDLLWIPLGAGAHVVKVSGVVFEAVSALVQRRSRCALSHSALQLQLADERSVVEQVPVIDAQGRERSVVAEGPVGMRWAGHLRVFRYEVRCWRGGEIPDLRASVESPVRLSDDGVLAQHVLDVLPTIPTPVWGRDELHTGEMWNSNSVVSWALTRAGIDLSDVRPPVGGRAPGWHAGVVVAARGASD